MSAQVTKQKPQPPKYLMCIKVPNSRKLEKGKVYEVVEADEMDYYIKDGSRDIGWFYAEYFKPMPPTYDHVEQRLRAILTAPCHDHTCKKCGAPTPCSYHP